MIARLSAFVIWALVAAATVFWGARLLVRADPVPANAVVVSEAVQMRGDLSRLLGAEPVAAVAVAPQMSTRFRLLGVMAAKPSPQGLTPGVALISIDGKPARAFTAGARIEDQLILRDVSLRSASIGAAEGAAAFVLEIPALPSPATGTLPKAATESMSQPPPPSAAPAPVQRPAPGASPVAPPRVVPSRPGLSNPNASR
jgi:general secretion pathway protein C